MFMSIGLGGNTTLFPVKTRLKNAQKRSFDSSIFHGGRVELENENGQRKMRMKVDGMDMPFMTWSADGLLLCVGASYAVAQQGSV